MWAGDAVVTSGQLGDDQVGGAVRPQIGVGVDVGGGAVAGVVLTGDGDRGLGGEGHRGCLGQDGDQGGWALGSGGGRVAHHGAVGIEIVVGGIADRAACIVGWAEVDHGLVGVQDPVSLRQAERHDRGLGAAGAAEADGAGCLFPVVGDAG